MRDVGKWNSGWVQVASLEGVAVVSQLHTEKKTSFFQKYARATTGRRESAWGSLCNSPQ